VALAPIAFVLNVRGLDVAHLPERVSPRFPRRLFIATAFFQGLALLVLWVVRIVAIMKAGKFPPELAGMSTLETQAIDLGFVVPLSISSAILLWRRSPWGYLLAAITLAFSFILCIVIPAWILIPLFEGGNVNLVEAVPFLAISGLGLFLNVAFYRGVSDRPGAMLVLLAGFGLLSSSCGREEARREDVHSPPPPALQDSSDLGDENVAEGPEAAVEVVRSYYAAIDAHDFERAYQSWGESGPPGQSLEEFSRGFSATSSVRVETGAPSRIEPAAGSRFVEVPVTIFAETITGQKQRFEGKYVLRRTVVDGASPDQRRWHLYRAKIGETKGDPDSEG